MSIPADLPVVDKRELMRHFDDWVADRVGDPRRRRRVPCRPQRGSASDISAATRSGRAPAAQVCPRIFVQDDASLGTYDALLAAEVATTRAARRLRARRPGEGRPRRADRRDRRSLRQHRVVAARVARRAVERRHAAFRSSGAAARARRRAERVGPRVRRELPDDALAPGRRAGGRTPHDRAGARLVRRRASVPGGARCVSSARSAAPSSTSTAPPNACASLSAAATGALHVNADWVVLEPVDRRYRPTARRRTPSETVLVTNLANQRAAGDPLRPGRQRRRAAASPVPAAAPAARDRGRRAARRGARRWSMRRGGRSGCCRSRSRRSSSRRRTAQSDADRAQLRAARSGCGCLPWRSPQ